MAIPILPEEAIDGMVDEPDYQSQGSEEDEALWNVNLSGETRSVNVVTDESNNNVTQEMVESDQESLPPPLVERDISDSDDDSMPILEHQINEISTSDEESDHGSEEQDEDSEDEINLSSQFNENHLEWSTPTFMRQLPKATQPSHPTRNGLTLYCLKDADLTHYLEKDEYIPSHNSQQFPCKHFKCCKAFGRPIPPPDEREYARCLDEFEPALSTFNFDSSSS
jgi:hypothetical protein